jgi:hypothetical protein
VKVTRAKAPRTIPTIAQVAAALMISAAPAEAATDAGVATKATVFVTPPADGGADIREPVRVFIDDEPIPFGQNVEIAAGSRVVRAEYRDGNSSSERMLFREGETRTLGAGSCPYHPDRVLGGAPPPNDQVESGGCCGNSRGAATAKMDMRIVAMAALAAVFSARRRKRRAEP